MTIEKVVSYLKRIPKISAGGFGVAAYIIGKILLSEWKNPTATFLYKDSDPNGLELYKSNSIALDKDGVLISVATHIICECDDKVYDSGISELFPFRHEGVSMNNLLSVINSPKMYGDCPNDFAHISWNYAFDRKVQVPAIARYLNLNLDEIKIKNYNY